ncbi:MAG: biliverdin-producing heme oxygenase [Sphingomonadaceae bacterium]|nr:biliverdin-producing heme oxygenase [Sphingomonadaceae bacterium]
MSRQAGLALTALRGETCEAHERLDALFGRFDLRLERDYRGFLTAHAMALPPLEAATGVAGMGQELDDWDQRKRTQALTADLRALGAGLPSPLEIAPLSDTDEAWGTAYVLEGSRLGGAYLARQIGDGLPNSYLGTPQAPGAWRKFLETLEERLYSADRAARAGAAAARAFALFERAGREMLERTAE